MSFIGTLSEVATNGNQFKQWEKINNDKDAQRKALTEKKNPTQEELKNAQKKGKVIMDVIDIMDTHSEDVSENVESAVMPLAQLLPMGVTMLTGMGLGKYYIDPAHKQKREAIQKFYETESGKRLQEIAERVIHLSGHDFRSDSTPVEDLKRLYIWDGKDTSILNKRTLKILGESSNKEAQSFVPELKEIGEKFKKTKGIGSFNKKIGIAAGITGSALIGTYVLANVMAAKLQVGSSRVARWQSRQDLNDPKYFVQYTDEQIEQAKENLKNKPEEKKGLFGGLFNKKGEKTPFNRSGGIFTIKDTIKDSKKYSDWKKTYNQDSKRIQRTLTNEELIEAERDQEVIQRVTKQINNKAEEYSENMEVAAGVLIGGTPFLGAAISEVVNKVVDKTGLGEKFSKAMFEKIKAKGTKEEAQELQNLFEKMQPKVKEGAKKATTDMRALGKYFEKSWSILTRNETKATGKFDEFYNTASKFLKVGLSTKTARNRMVNALGTVITGTVGVLIGLKLQKNSARAGRYIAKREIEENPANFIGYTQEEFDSVQDVKGKKKTVPEKFKEYITFIPRMVKESMNYEKYKKTEHKDHKELLSELVKSADISESQLNDAKDAQRKLFVTFENVDDKSQEYSESIEVVTEMAQPLIPFVGTAIASLPFVVGGIKLYKKGGAGATEAITGFLSKHTNFLKGKTVRKYLNDVANNITSTVENKQYVSSKFRDSETLKRIKDIPVGDIHLGKIGQAFKDALSATKGKNNELEAFLKNLAGNNALKQLSKEELINVIKKASPDEAETLIGMIDIVAKDAKNASEIAEAFIKQYSALLPNYKISQLGTKSVSEIIEMLSTKENIQSQFKGRTLFDRVINNRFFKGTFGRINTVKETTNGFNKMWSELDDKLDIVPKTVQKLGLTSEEFKANMTENTLKGAISALGKTQITTGKWKESIQKLIDSKTLPDGVADILKKIKNSNMTDEQALRIFNNIEAVTKNIPSEELTNIIDAAINAFHKNPEKFAQCLESGDFASVLVTEGVIKASVVGSVAWAGLSMLLTFTLESIFASTQKKAGRLGVMRALDELKDKSYYANEKPNQNQTPVELNNTVNNTQNSNGLGFLNMKSFLSKFSN